METIRILTALEDLLGSLGPQINAIMSRAIVLENSKEGTGNILLEDENIAAILQMTKEKLSGQIIAGMIAVIGVCMGDFYMIFYILNVFHRITGAAKGICGSKLY